MSFRCEICGKGLQFGNHVSHANNKRKRVFRPNLKRVRVIQNGTVKKIKACTRCIRSGNVIKPAKRTKTPETTTLEMQI